MTQQPKQSRSEREHLKVTVYTPASYARRPGELIGGMLRDFIGSRDLAWRLFVRNLAGQYRQSILGYFWIFLPPLVTTLVWVFLNGQKILDIAETKVPYPVFVLTGNLMWTAFVRSLQAPMMAVQREKSTLTKLNFPREALITAGFGDVIFNGVLPLILLVPVFLWYRVALSPLQLLAPVGFVMVLLFGYTLGLLVAPVGLLFHDIRRAIPIATRFLFFLTPVVYPPPEQFPASLVADINPIAPMINTARDWFTGLPSDTLLPFLIISGTTLILFVAGLVLFRLAMPHIVERMSA